MVSSLLSKRKIIFAATLLALPLLVQGCVSRSSYNDNVNSLMRKMDAERARNLETERALEIKAQERGRTLSELTTRYIELKAQQDYSQAKLGRLQSDLEGLLRDMSEMKLVIFTNFKGSEANEMMLKLNSMQKTVQEILRKSTEAMPAPAAVPMLQGQ
jgi:ERCC4-related helicase